MRDPNWPQRRDASFRELRSQAREVLADSLGSARRVAFVGFPWHGNIGDSLIFLGSLALLDELTIDVGYIADGGTYDPEALRAAVPVGPIVLAGGGNFGDRYHHHQLQRERVIQDFPDRRIVVLPQTMEWFDSAALEQCRNLYVRHPDLTVLIRDRDGVDAATAIFGPDLIRFSPDHALGAAPVEAVPPATARVKVLKRDDGEAVSDTWNAELFPSRVISDWTIDPQTRVVVHALAVFLVTSAKVGRFSRALERVRVRAYRSIAELLVAQGVRTLSVGETVVTDRLHAAILGLLIGREVFAVDNANRKLSLMFADYLHTVPGMHLCADFSAAATSSRGDGETRIGAHRP